MFMQIRKEMQLRLPKCYNSNSVCYTQFIHQPALQHSIKRDKIEVKSDPAGAGAVTSWSLKLCEGNAIPRARGEIRDKTTRVLMQIAEFLWISTVISLSLSLSVVVERHGNISNSGDPARRE